MVTTRSDWPPPPEFPDMTLLFRRSIEMYGVDNFEQLKRDAAAAVHDGTRLVIDIVPCCVSRVSEVESHTLYAVT